MRPIVYYTPVAGPAAEPVAIHSLGIREPLPAPYDSRQGHPGWFLFMHFHERISADLGQGWQDYAPHTAILWEPGCKRIAVSRPLQWRHSWLNFRGQAAQDRLRCAAIPLNTPLSFSGESQIIKCLFALHAELADHIHPDPEILLGHLAVWLREMRRALDPASGTAAIPPEFVELRKYIEGNLHARLTLPQLAARVHLSPSQFSHRFRCYFALPPLRFIQQLRLGRAATLLQNATLAVFQVAQEVGFQDPLHFSRQFRRRFGVSPQGYRAD